MSNTEIKLLSTLRNPQYQHFVTNISPNMVTGDRVTHLAAYQIAYEKYGSLSAEAIESILGEALPPEYDIPVNVDPIPLICDLQRIARKRNLQEMAQELLDESKKYDPDIKALREKLDTKDDFVTHDTSLIPGISQFVAQLRAKETQEYKWLYTGMPFLDAMVGGEWARGEISIITARSGGGKCINGDVLMASGLYKHISEVNVGEHVLTLDTDTHKIVPRIVLGVMDVGVKKTFVLRTNRGFELKTSDIHPYFTQRGWVQVKDLVVGDYIATVRNTYGFSAYRDVSSPVDTNWLKFIAYMIGDGCFNRFSFSSGNDSITREFTECVLELGGSLKRNNAYDYRIRGKQIHKRWKEYGLKGLSSDKYIPEDIMRLPNEYTSMFLSRLYGTDGWASVGSSKQEIGYCTVSYRLANDIITLLHRFCIPAKLRVKYPMYVYKGEKRKGQKAYQVIISDRDYVIKFCEQIGIYGKETAVSAVLQSALSHKPIGGNDVIPKTFISDHNSSVFSRSGTHRARLSNSDNVMHRVYANGDIFWDRVLSIEETEPVPMWDLEIEGTHNFIANHIVAHNTACMGSSALNMARMHKNTGESSPVAIFSMEMPKAQMVARFVADMTGIDSRVIRMGRYVDGKPLTAQDKELIDNALTELQSLPLHIVDAERLSAQEIIRTARALMVDHGVQVFFIDYLQLMAYDNDMGKHYGLGDGVKQLKAFVKRYNVAVVLLAQYHETKETIRDATDPEKDCALWVHLAIDFDERDDQGICPAKIEVRKSRHGPTGTATVLYNARRLSFLQKDMP